MTTVTPSPSWIEPLGSLALFLSWYSFHTGTKGAFHGDALSGRTAPAPGLREVITTTTAQVSIPDKNFWGGFFFHEK